MYEVIGGRERRKGKLGGDTHSRFELRLVGVCDDQGVRASVAALALPHNLTSSFKSSGIISYFTTVVCRFVLFSFRALLPL